VTGLLVYVAGFSIVWIMWKIYFKIRELEVCVDAICRDLDELRIEATKDTLHGKK